MTGRNGNFDIRLCLDERTGDMNFAMMQEDRGSKKKACDKTPEAFCPRHKGHEGL